MGGRITPLTAVEWGMVRQMADQKHRGIQALIVNLEEEIERSDPERAQLLRRDVIEAGHDADRWRTLYHKAGMRKGR